MKIEERPAIASKVVIVTGASSGIGECAALEFARAGAWVVLAARRGYRLEWVARRINGAGGIALAVPTDLTNPEHITNLVQSTLRTFRRIDVLVNAAGWGRYDWFEELSAEDLRNQYEVNVLGMAELIRQVLPTMKAQRSGHILNLSSYASKIAVPPLTVYASTKYAVEGLSDALRREVAPWGIAVTRIHPSAVTGTEFNKQARRNGGITYRSVPIGRVSREEVARALVDLVEQPRRSLLLSRLYDPAVIANTLFPGLVDRLMAAWVIRQRRKELKDVPEQAPVKYAPAFSPLSLAAIALGALLIGRAISRKL
jgi:NADP-dependent 3-hydroxy acid dehydrogenase YdfG